MDGLSDAHVEHGRGRRAGAGVIPVLTPAEMAGVDRQAPEPVDVLVGRAGAAVARRAARLLNGAYGKKITVVAGKGNNGADGRLAAKLLAANGARVNVLEAADAGRGLGPAPVGPGDRRRLRDGLGTARILPPTAGRAPVLAVDIPSGPIRLDRGGARRGGAMPAVATVTFASLKPGLLLGPAPTLAGDVELADIGLGAAGRRHGHAAGSSRTATSRPCSRAGLTRRTSGRPPSRSWPARRG